MNCDIKCVVDKADGLKSEVMEPVVKTEKERHEYS